MANNSRGHVVRRSDYDALEGLAEYDISARRDGYDRTTRQYRYIVRKPGYMSEQVARQLCRDWGLAARWFWVSANSHKQFCAAWESVLARRA